LALPLDGAALGPAAGVRFVKLPSALRCCLGGAEAGLPPPPTEFSLFKKLVLALAVAAATMGPEFSSCRNATARNILQR
jgi:hypothetical protein